MLYTTGGRLLASATAQLSAAPAARGKKKKIIVVGGGIGGLCCAYELTSVANADALGRLRRSVLSLGGARRGTIVETLRTYEHST